MQRMKDGPSERGRYKRPRGTCVSVRNQRSVQKPFKSQKVCSRWKMLQLSHHVVQKQVFQSQEGMRKKQWGAPERGPRLPHYSGHSRNVNRWRILIWTWGGDSRHLAILLAIEHVCQGLVVGESVEDCSLNKMVEVLDSRVYKKMVPSESAIMGLRWLQLGHSISNEPGGSLDRRRFWWKNYMMPAFMGNDCLGREFALFWTVHPLEGAKLPCHAWSIASS